MFSTRTAVLMAPLLASSAVSPRASNANLSQFHCCYFIALGNIKGNPPFSLGYIAYSLFLLMSHLYLLRIIISSY